MSSVCIICGHPITDQTDSEEHIIQNSVGGMRKVRRFLHARCNSITGDSWDAEFARQMNPLCLFFDIVRDRGVPPSLKIETTAGEELIMRAGGGFAPAKPNYQEIPTPEGLRISFGARNKREARKMLKGVKAKHPQADVEKILNDAVETTAYPRGALKLSFQCGGQGAGRSIVKTAAAFARSVGISVENCDVALNYLRDEKSSPCFGHYYATDLVRDRPAGLPFHCVAVSGNSKTGMLLAYVEYFGCARMVVCLSQSYQGPVLRHSYAINPLTGQEIGVDVRLLKFDAAELEAIYRYERTPKDAHEKAFAMVLDTAMKIHFEKEKNRAIEDAVHYAFANCGAREGEMLTDQQKWKLGGLVAHRMQPFFLRHMVRRQPPQPPVG